MTNNSVGNTQTQSTDLLKRAFIKITELEGKLEKSKYLSEDPIAVIGMACRFPGGANSPKQFWNNLLHGVDSIVETPQDRWSIEKYMAGERGEVGKISTSYGGFIDKVHNFDASFFGISPREADFMDPQHRIALEVAWEAFEHACIPEDELYGSNTGVFLGISTFDYYRQLAVHLDDKDINAYVGTGNSKSAAAGRISYCLGLKGPSIAYDTACSSSLVALDAAVMNLRAKRCDIAIVGGVNLMLCPSTSIAFSQAQMLARDGRCKSFSKDADGYGRGEGCGMVVLQNMNQAKKNRRKILAVVRGVSVNQDGASSGLTVPNGPAQQQVMRSALKESGLTPDLISYVEAHGTGTALGDPIELGAINSVYGENTERSIPLYVGSLKTNIGHLEAAAGIGGFIKLVLSLQNKTIPPHLHFVQGNSAIPWDTMSLRIPQEPISWQCPTGRRICAISSFGFAGTNAHAIVEEAPDDADQIVLDSNAATFSSFTLSAKSEPALFDLISNHVEALQEQPEIDISALCKSTNTGRSHFSHRLHITSNSTNDILVKLRSWQNKKNGHIDGLTTGAGNTDYSPRVAFVFTGQGSQYQYMGQQLFNTEPHFRSKLLECAELLNPHLGVSILDVIFSEDSTQLDQTLYAQPALFSLGYSLADLLMHWGMRPSLVMGHSVGEYIAACIAGVFSLPEAIKLVAARGKLMQTLSPGGKMLSILADENVVSDFVSSNIDEVSIAAINAPQQTVISGAGPVIDVLAQKVHGLGIRSVPLNVSHAFHSPLMKPILSEFRKIAAEVSFSPIGIPIISNVDGQLKPDGTLTVDYWCEHIIKPVKFLASVRTLLRQNVDIAFEIGANAVLTPLAKLSDTTGSGTRWVPTMYRNRNQCASLHTAIGEYYVNGGRVDWHAVNSHNNKTHVDLPNYPFQRKQFHFGNALGRVVENGDLDLRGASSKILDPISVDSRVSDYCYSRRWVSQPFSKPDVSCLVEDKKSQNWVVFDAGSRYIDHLVKEIRNRGEYCARISFSSKTTQQTSNEDYHIEQMTDLSSVLTIIQRDTQASAPKVPPVIKWNVIWDTPIIELDSDPGIEAQNLATSFVQTIQQIEPFNAYAEVGLWVTHCIDGERNQLLQAPISGLAESLLLERPDFLRGVIHLLSDQKFHLENAKYIWQEISSGVDESEVLFRDQQRYVARFTKSNLPSDAIATNPLVAEGSYLVTGGTGALGFMVVEWLVDAGAKSIILAGRRVPSIELKKNIDKMCAKGAHIVFKQCDVAKGEDVSRLFLEINSLPLPLRGVVHAAGVLDDVLFHKMSAQNIANTFAPKVAGSWLLHEHTKGLKLDFFVLFSSIASFIGSPGQGNYAAANRFLDALANYRRGLGLVATSISWGPWDGSGMAMQNKHINSARLDRFGIRYLNPEHCRSLFLRVISENFDNLAVLDVDWQRFSTNLDVRQKSRYTNLVDKTKHYTHDFGVTTHLSKEQRLTQYADQVRFIIAKVLGLPESDVGSNTSFIKLGMDSLLVMETASLIKQNLHLTIYPREIYSNPTLESLAKYLFDECEKDVNYSETEVKSEQQVELRKSSVIFTSIPKEKKLQSPMVFLLSSPRAGSTLLRSMLAGHPGLFSPPELHLLPFDNMSQRAEALAGSYMDEGLLRAQMELFACNIEESRKFVDEHVINNTSIYEIYSKLMEAAEPRILLDKSPTYAGSFGVLENSENLFANAKYIHLVRHPYSVIESFARMRMDKLIGVAGADAYEIAERVWYQSNRNIDKFFGCLRPDTHYTVLYEDLVEDPETVMRGICQFIGIEFHSRLLNPYEEGRMNDGVSPKSLSIGDPNFLNHQTIERELGKNWMNIRLPRSLNSDSVSLCNKYGYTLPNQGPHVPTVDNETIRQSSVKVHSINYTLSHWGDPSNPMVLCLHGIMDQGPIWADVASTLVLKGYYVVAPDLRGHGLTDHWSESSAPRIMDLVSDIETLADNLLRDRKEPKFTLLAHSMGTLVAAIFAACRPDVVNRICLIEPVLPAREFANAVERTLAEIRSNKGRRNHMPLKDLLLAKTRMGKFYPGIREELLELLFNRVIKYSGDSFIWTWDPRLSDRAIMNHGIERSQYLAILSSLKIPTVVLLGSLSQYNRAEDKAALQSSLDSADFRTCEAGHGIPFQNPEQVAKCVYEWCSEAEVVKDQRVIIR